MEYFSEHLGFQHGGARNADERSPTLPLTSVSYMVCSSSRIPQGAIQDVLLGPGPGSMCCNPKAKPESPTKTPAVPL